MSAGTGSGVGEGLSHREGLGEELTSGVSVPSGRQVDIDDLAVLVDDPVQVVPAAADLHVGLVYEPAIAGRVPAWSGGVDEQRGEALHPPVDRDMVDNDAALGQEFFDVT